MGGFDAKRRWIKERRKEKEWEWRLSRSNGRGSELRRGDLRAWKRSKKRQEERESWVEVSVEVKD